MFSFNKTKDLVGIDIGSSSIKLVQLREQKGIYHLLNVGLMPLPPEAIVDNTLMDSTSVAGAIKNLVASLGIKNKEVACSISGNSVIIRKISPPAMPEAQLEDQIVWEAEQYIPFDINDVNIDFQILSSDTGEDAKMNVLLVASKKDIISDYISVFNECGMRLAVMDVDSFAVQNAFEVCHEAGLGEIVALVNIGASIMNINVVKEGVTLFTRDVQMGGNLYTEEIQKHMGLSSSEAEAIKVLARNGSNADLLNVIASVNETITQEIRRSLDFYNSTASEDRITRIFLSGGCSKVYNLLESVTTRLDLPVEMINPFFRFSWDEKDFDQEYLSEIAPFMVLATGLAIRKAGDGW